MDTIRGAQGAAAREFRAERKHLVLGEDKVARINGLIWIPSKATELQLSLLIIAHAGAMGHRGSGATRQSLAGVFSWKGLHQDAEAFVKGCLQCMCAGQGHVPRPLGEALHAVEPNQLLHCDFLSMPVSDDGTRYIHVCVDDASRFVQLTGHKTCKANDAVDAMQQWFGYFGVVPHWMSDQGPHYKNQVVEMLKRAYGAGHSFSPPTVHGLMARLR
jgi:hypothetical protein